MRRSRGVRAALALLIGQTAGQAVSFFRAIAVARLLQPADLGEFALVVAIYGGLQAASQPGLTQALIARKERPTASMLGGALVVMVLRGAAIMLLLFVGAGVLADAFGVPALAGLIRLSAPTALLAGLANPAVALLHRDLRMKRVAALSIVPLIVDAAVSVTATWFLRTAVGPALGFLAGVFAGSAASWIIAPRVARLRVVVAEQRQLWAFGRWRTMDGLLAYLATRLDDLVLGRFAGTQPLGEYGVAYRLGSLPATDVVNVVSRVALPSLVDLDEGEQRTTYFLRFVRMTLSVAAMLSVMTAVLARPLVLTLLGPMWEAAVAPLQILAVAGFIRAGVGATGPLIFAYERPAWATAIQIVRVAVLVPSLGLVLWADSAGAAFAAVISIGSTIPVVRRALVACQVAPGRVAAHTVRAVGVALPAGAVAGVALLLFVDHRLQLVAGGIAGLAVWWATLGVVGDGVKGDLRSVLRPPPHRLGADDDA